MAEANQVVVSVRSNTAAGVHFAATDLTNRNSSTIGSSPIVGSTPIGWCRLAEIQRQEGGASGAVSTPFVR